MRSCRKFYLGWYLFDRTHRQSRVSRFARYAHAERIQTIRYWQKEDAYATGSSKFSKHEVSALFIREHFPELAGHVEGMVCV